MSDSGFDVKFYGYKSFLSRILLGQSHKNKERGIVINKILPNLILFINGLPPNPAVIFRLQRNKRSFVEAEG